MAYTQARVDLALDAANNGIDFARLHDADPGAAGTTGVLAESSPQAIALPAAGGDGAASDDVVFPITGATMNPVTHVSLWVGDPDAAGTYAGSGVLSPQHSFAGGSSTLTVTVNTTAAAT